eukprot:CAMPEP_0198215826 /NCGR_PEP_ID=MMETSP1445-20131203/52996_1 /TAXON_ID=36898 /ORGANISM="Pyramimonas sp., Strain CCMP2087" /LENGTH=196 /DNA_ID=CAMNT_0043891753 /DNA_START=384 /DNA_END=974 /DNA_ORIENTATION=-
MADGCVCGLNPCLMPMCAAVSWDSWSGTFVADPRSLAPYQGSPVDVIRSMLDLASAAAGDTLVDLGAGDGRVLLEAFLHSGVKRAVGYELDPAVCAIGRAHIAGRMSNEGFKTKEAQNERVELIEGDAREANLEGVNIVLMYMLPEGHRVLCPFLEEKLPIGCGTRVVTHQWPIPGWPVGKQIETETGTKLFMYKR